MAAFSSGSTATLAIKIVTDATDAVKGLDSTAGQTSKFKSGMQTAGRWGAIASAAILGFGAAAFDAASDAEQAGGAVDAVFKGNAKGIHEFARSAAQNTGLSAAAYEQMAATFGAQLKNMGIASDKLVPQTDDLIGLGADLAAQFGGDTADAVDALSSLMRGERDPIERYGVSIKDADIKARKAAMGLDGLTGEADRNATTVATLALLYDQTADAQGAFAREADTAAGQQQRANAAFDDAKASLGQALLPIMSKAAAVFAKVSKFIGENALAFQIFAGVILAVTAGVWLFNAALAANPIVLIGIAVAALVAGIILLWKNCETFRNIVKTIGRIGVQVFRAVRDAVVWVIDKLILAYKWTRDKLVAAFNTAKNVAVLVFTVIRNAIQWVIDKVAAAYRWVHDILASAFTWVKNVATLVFTAIRNWIAYIIDKVAALYRWVHDVLVSAFTWVRNVAILVFTTIRNWIVYIIDKVAALYRWVHDVLVSAFTWLRNVAILVFTTISNWIRYVIDKVAALYRWVHDVLVSAFTWVSNVAVLVFTTISNAVQWVIDKVYGLVSILANSLGWAFQQGVNAGIWVFEVVKNSIQWVIDKVESLIGWLGRIHWPSPPGWLGKVGGWFSNLFSVPGGPAFPVRPRPHLYAVAMPGGGIGVGSHQSTAGAGGASINITVNGALDPDAVARQIERILAGRTRRVRGPQLRGVV